MDAVGEATRQYQAFLEAERRVCTECAGALSMLDVVDRAGDETQKAAEHLFRVWMERR